MWSRLSRVVELTLLLIFGAVLLSSGTGRPGDEQDRARAYTRDIEFEYLSWIVDAAQVKAEAGAAGIPGYMDRVASRIVVSDYLLLIQKTIRAEDALNRIYADPAISDKYAAASLIRETVKALYLRQDELAPLAEGVLQAQVAEVAADLGLAALGQPIPAVLYRSTSIPDALVVSPRGQIRQSANISIQADLPIEEQAALEQRVEKGLDASALIVPVGGVGVYPTMIMRTTDRRWLASTIAHEWTHNYLQLRPLGLLYDHTPELRTMNESTADIVGTEIGSGVMLRFYSGMGSVWPPDPMTVSLRDRYPDPTDADPPPFDFRSEMHTTRVTVDALLASGRIVEAEEYMERRRRLFVDHGYFIRRLNQAYFAFYGAYADIPGGPAGKDPVGPAVRTLRTQSRSLADFLNRMAWMTSFEQLQAVVGQ
ncbi:MAG: hypothetical protein V1755_11895 [Chloroflexota bacterium]